MTELYEDMMTALENAYFQMRTAGLGYATHALEAQMDSFKVRMAMDSKGMVEYKRPDGLVDGGEIIDIVEFYANEPKLETCFDPKMETVIKVVLHHKGKKTAKYAIAIAKVD